MLAFAADYLSYVSYLASIRVTHTHSACDLTRASHNCPHSEANHSNINMELDDQENTIQTLMVDYKYTYEQVREYLDSKLWTSSWL